MLYPALILRRCRLLGIGALVFVATSCSLLDEGAPSHPGGKADDIGGDTLACGNFQAPLVVGTLRKGDAREISGLVASQKNPGVYWAHNDGPSDGELLAFDRRGTILATVHLGVEVEDAEDIAMGPGPIPGESYLFLGDIGDNDRKRKSVAVHRFVEPVIEAQSERRDFEVDEVETAEFRYGDDKAHNAEALLVDPDSGDVLIISKSSEDDSKTRVFAGPLFGGAAAGDKAQTLPLVASSKQDKSLEGSVVAADISSDGRSVIVGFKHNAFHLFHRQHGAPLWQTFAEVACTIERPAGHHEAVGFSAEGGGFYLIPEGRDPDIVFIAEAMPCPAFSQPVKLAEVASDDAVEISGLVASRTQAGILWAINDPEAGVQRSRVLGIEAATGSVLAEVELIDAPNINWEDLAIGPGPNGPALYIADTGDNDLERESVTVYRIDEPQIALAPAPVFDSVIPEVFALRFDDDKPHDVEALLVDPLRGDLLLVSRRRGADARTRVFAAPGFAFDATDATLDEVIDERDADELDAIIVAGDVSADGLGLGLARRNASPIFWQRHPDAALWESFAYRACVGPSAPGKQDSLALAAKSFGFWQIPEGASPPIFQVSER